MKKIFIKLFMLIGIINFVLVACQEDEYIALSEKQEIAANTNWQNISLKNGVLVFKSRTDMYNYLSDVADDKILFQKESELGFKSLYAICSKAFSEDEKLWQFYENLNYTEKEFAKAFETGKLKNYSDATMELVKQGILKFEEFEGEKVVDYLTCAPYLVRILNNKNMVCINDTIFQYNEHEIKFIPNGNFDLIKEFDNISGNEKEYKGIVVAKERKEKDYYYPTHYVRWPRSFPSDQSGTSWNSKKIMGYLEIKHFDYLSTADGNAPWYYSAFFIRVYTYSHRFGKWRYDKDKVYLSSFEWYRDLIWQGNYNRESHFPISAEITTNRSSGGTYLMIEKYDNPNNINNVWYWANAVLQREDNTNVNIHLMGDAHEVPSLWW